MGTTKVEVAASEPMMRESLVKGRAVAAKSATLSIVQQGDLLQVRCRLHGLVAPPRQPKPTRGRITDFSRKSRRRLMQRLAKLKVPEKGMTFLTLTYPSIFPSPSVAKAHLDAWLKRIARRFPDAAGFWRLEFQKRGAPHFHLLMVNMPFWDKKEVMESWADVIKIPTVFTRIEHVRSKRGCYSYMSKYIGKMDDGVDLTTGHNSPLPIGRVWGVHNAAGLEYHDIETQNVIGHATDLLQVFRLLAGQISEDFEHIDPDNEQLSFSLFATNAKALVTSIGELLRVLGYEPYDREVVWDGDTSDHRMLWGEVMAI